MTQLDAAVIDEMIRRIRECESRTTIGRLCDICTERLDRIQALAKIGLAAVEFRRVDDRVPPAPSVEWDKVEDQLNVVLDDYLKEHP